MNGYGPDQVLRRLDVELNELQAALAIVTIFAGNDYGNLLRNKLYRLDSNGELAEIKWTYSQVVGDHYKPHDRIALIRLVKKAYWRLLAIREFGDVQAEEVILDNSNESQSAGKRHDMTCVPGTLEQSLEEYNNYIVQGDNEIRQLSYDHYDGDIALKQSMPSAEFKIQMMEAVLLDNKQSDASQNTALVLLIVPTPVDIVPD